MEKKFLKLTDKINERKGESVVVAIDGNCGAGKTYLSNLLKDEYECNVIHMDDFFLPSYMKTKTRLNEIAGNFHYERFEREVLSKLDRGIIKYVAYDCSKDEFSEPVYLQKKWLTVIEGSYSLSHGFGKYYDISVCLTCDERTQRERIKERCSDYLLKMFTDVWIPMENRYIESSKLKNRCDILIET